MLVKVGTNGDVEAVSLIVDVLISLVDVGVSVTVLVTDEDTVDDDVDSVVVCSALVEITLDVVIGTPRKINITMYLCLSDWQPFVVRLLQQVNLTSDI
jgi:hypothetical protein